MDTVIAPLEPDTTAAAGTQGLLKHFGPSRTEHRAVHPRFTFEDLAQTRSKTFLRSALLRFARRTHLHKNPDVSRDGVEKHCLADPLYLPPVEVELLRCFLTTCGIARGRGNPELTICHCSARFPLSFMCGSV
jgi:hypothetical protein